MEGLSKVISFIVGNWDMILASVVAVLVAIIGLMHAVIAIALMIPGAQPEEFLQKGVDALQKAVDFVAKFSKK
jgi:hypothetical protein